MFGLKSFKFSSLFKSKDAKELLLTGMKPLPNSPEAIQRDVTRIIEYANGPAYQAWDAEIWANVYQCLDKILAEKSTNDEVNQYRGELRALLNSLQVADKARKKQEEIKRKMKATSSSR